MKGALGCLGNALGIALLVFVVVMAVTSGISLHTTVSPIYLEGDIERNLGPLVGPDPSASCPDEELPDRVGASTTCTLSGSRATRVVVTVTGVADQEVDFDLRTLDLPGQEPSVVRSRFEIRESG